VDCSVWQRQSSNFMERSYDNKTNVGDGGRCTWRPKIATQTIICSSLRGLQCAVSQVLAFGMVFLSVFLCLNRPENFHYEDQTKGLISRHGLKALIINSNRLGSKKAQTTGFWSICQGPRLHFSTSLYLPGIHTFCSNDCFKVFLIWKCIKIIFFNFLKLFFISAY
jgi:hypothetical protein